MRESARRIACGIATALALAPFAGPARGAPVFQQARLHIDIAGLAPITIEGSGTVDIQGQTLSMPSDFQWFQSGGQPLPSLVVPVTSTTQVNQLKMSRLSNLTGVFSFGGVTNQIPGEVCPSGGPAAGQACIRGGGIGGAMALSGTLRISVIPNIVVIPFDLRAAHVGIGGTGTGDFTTEAAGWTTGTALIHTGNRVHSAAGGTPGMSSPTGGAATNTLRLVTPTYVDAFGTVFPVFVTLEFLIVNIPEPTTLALLAAGLAGLGLSVRGRATRTARRLGEESPDPEDRS